MYYRDEILEYTSDREVVLYIRGFDSQQALNEALIKKKELYHGSNLDLDHLEASAVDFGNTFNKPGWSLFAWADKEKAIYWAVFTFFDRLIRGDQFHKEYIEFIKDPANDVKWSHLWYWPDDCCFVQDKLAKFFLEKCKENDIDRYVYIYTIDGTKYQYSIGNDSEHAEYTIRSKDKIHFKKKEKIEVTEALLNKYHIMATTDTLRMKSRDMAKKHGTARGEFKRGFLSIFMNHDFLYQDRALVKRIYRDIKNGVLKPGDDIDAYLKENHLKFDNITLFTRLWRMWEKKFG